MNELLKATKGDALQFHQNLDLLEMSFGIVDLHEKNKLLSLEFTLELCFAIQNRKK